MGQILLKFYESAREIGGMKAQLKLAILTKIPSNKAANLLDSPENIKKFETSINIIKKEFKK
ncbi:MAG: hypothetical protein ABF289_20285 [Clostridiales bacterium]